MIGAIIGDWQLGLGEEQGDLFQTAGIVRGIFFMDGGGVASDG